MSKSVEGHHVASGWNHTSVFICVYIRSRIHKISRHLLCEALVFPYGWSLSEFAGILLVIH